jgi:hypothetical protein
MPRKSLKNKDGTISLRADEKRRDQTAIKRTAGTIKKACELGILAGHNVFLALRNPKNGQINMFTNLRNPGEFLEDVSQQAHAEHVRTITHHEFAKPLEGTNNLPIDDIANVPMRMMDQAKPNEEYFDLRTKKYEEAPAPIWAPHVQQEINRVTPLCLHSAAEKDDEDEVKNALEVISRNPAMLSEILNKYLVPSGAEPINQTITYNANDNSQQLRVDKEYDFTEAPATPSAFMLAPGTPSMCFSGFSLPPLTPGHHSSFSFPPLTPSGGLCSFAPTTPSSYPPPSPSTTIDWSNPASADFLRRFIDELIPQTTTTTDEQSTSRPITPFAVPPTPRRMFPPPSPRAMPLPPKSPWRPTTPHRDVPYTPAPLTPLHILQTQLATKEFDSNTSSFRQVSEIMAGSPNSSEPTQKIVVDLQIRTQKLTETMKESQKRLLEFADRAIAKSPKRV